MSLKSRIEKLERKAGSGADTEINIHWHDDPDCPMPEGLSRWVDPETGRLWIRLDWGDHLDDDDHEAEGV